ncbi:MAG: hypothetical protein PVF23_07360, partial [Chromatiales bacterium]
MKSFLTGFFSAIVLAAIILMLLPSEEEPLEQEQTIDLQIPDDVDTTGPVIILQPAETETTETGSILITEEPADTIAVETIETLPAEQETIADTPAETADAEEMTDTAGLVEEAGESAKEEAPKPLMVVHQVKSGDTLQAIFNTLGIDSQHYKRLIASKDVSRGLSRLRPGQMLYFYFDENRELTRLTHESDAIRSDNYSFTDER